MKFTNNRSSVAFFVYFSVVVLVIVKGQPTIDDDINEDDVSKLISTVRELRAEQAASLSRFAEFRAESVSRIGKLERQLAESVDKIVKLESQLAATSAAKPDAGN